MKVGERQQFSVKCECIITKNNIQINGKKKSKFSLISLNSEKKLLTAQPFGSQKEQELLSFPMAKLKAIHKKYIEEGKLTLEFLQRTERIQMKGVDVANTSELLQISSQILISSASKENLELLIKKIMAIKSASTEGRKPVEQPKPHTKKPPMEMGEAQERRGVALSRREMMNQAMQPKPKVVVPQSKPKAMRICFFDLPAGIINMILEFSQLTLDMRVINRRFSEHILRNIFAIKLGDEVDQKTFNKLSKWAVNVECRMKNVRNIELSDKYEQQELIKGRAKTLRFGGWREISAKNIMQLKGLRIFCLEIPYFIKFDLSQLFGLRLVELRLKSPQFTGTRCEFVKTEDLLYLLKTIKDLRVLELPYATSDLFTGIQNPKKMREIRTYYVSDTSKEEGWRDLSRFENLKVFSMWFVQRLGVKKEDHQITLRLPDGLLELEAGHFISKESLEKLPISLEKLRLVGENFYNIHIESIYLPQLQLLDISMSRNVRQDVLEFMRDLSIVTYWDRTTIDYAMTYANSRGIRLSTRNPDFK